MQGILVASSSVARTIGPFIGVSLYTAVNYQTWLLMLVLSGVFLMTMFLMIIMHRKINQNI